MRPPRDYSRLQERIAPSGDRSVLMQRAVDALWEALSSQGVSWVGFYLWSAQAPDELSLGPRRDKPACSPIGLHGACGRAFTARRALVVTDVARLGAGYIACDPRDRSEVVVPLLTADGSCWGVLDVDSHDLEAFTAADAIGLMQLMQRIGLSDLSHAQATITV